MNSINKYFSIFLYNYWSLETYNAYNIGVNILVNKKAIHKEFYNNLQTIISKPSMTEECCKYAEELLKNKKSDIKIVDRIWDNINVPERSGNKDANKNKKTNLLSEALSYTPPPAKYPPDTSSSRERVQTNLFSPGTPENIVFKISFSGPFCY
ncbi:hypothetical protein RCL_jg1928.t1 [Rhizophagus clarus]|uniref:Uncharacterized protein n=1 Tax=Rhizophagus clarus TaxID=94130 RepID=A0A8H3M283_9GLOM|nr:hypothetical protein RCL_jg1928.t1 [Rhizophagus clarus]